MKRKIRKNDIFSALEVAKFCGVVNQTAINWIKEGHLTAFQTPGGQYRVYADDLLKFFRDRKMRVPEPLKDLESEENAALLIMIVDDDKKLNDLIAKYLKNALPEADIIQAFDGFEAGQYIYSRKPQLIILDIDLPGVDGHQLCKKIKEDKNLPDNRVISITGLSSKEEEETILANGADAFFPKPVDFEELVTKIKEYMKEVLNE